MTAPGHHQEPAVVELSGGPLDGYRMPVTGWTAEQRATGVAHLSPHSAYGPGGWLVFHAFAEPRASARTGIDA